MIREPKRLGFEIKRTTSPQLTASMRVALADLKLNRLDVIHAGDQTFPLAPRVRAVAISSLLKEIQALR